MREIQRRLARSGGPARVQMVLAVALGMLATALIVAQATLLAQVIARGFLGDASLGQLSGQLAWLAAITVARGIVSFGFEASGRMGAARVMAGLRGRLVERCLVARPGALAGERSGELAASAIQGVDALEAYYARYLPQVALAALVPPVILLWVLPRDWEAAAILAVTFPLIPVFMVLIGRLAERSVRRRWRTLSGLSASFLDVVSGLETLRAFGRAADQEESIARASDRYRVETMATLRIAFLSALVLELLAMMGTALVAATIGVQLANGSLGLEAGLTVLLLAPELYMPLRQMGARFHASADGLAAAERIFEFLDRPDAVTVAARTAPAPDPRLAGVRLEKVGFSYGERDGAVLDGVELELEPAETVALTGPSGSGKTTLASLLLRLADPVEGRVTCDGVDLREVDPGEWRSRVAWVPQRPTIFSASASDNVRLLEPGASDEAVLAALAAANALEVAEALPEGIETPIGEGGRRVSAGQAQRIALARAFLRDPALVVLDEPSANLDPDSAELVWDAIAALTEDRTALLISHRPSLIRGADRFLELAGGRITEIAAAPAGAGA